MPHATPDLPEDRIREHLQSVRRITTSKADWVSFQVRFDAEFPRLHALFQRIYRPSADGELRQVVLDVAVAWKDRPADLKVVDVTRAAELPLGARWRGSGI